VYVTHRFCHEALPDWKEALFTALKSPKKHKSRPTMAVKCGDQVTHTAFLEIRQLELLHAPCAYWMCSHDAEAVMGTFSFAHAVPCHWSEARTWGASRGERMCLELNW